MVRSHRRLRQGTSALTYREADLDIGNGAVIIICYKGFQRQWELTPRSAHLSITQPCLQPGGLLPPGWRDAEGAATEILASAAALERERRDNGHHKWRKPRPSTREGIQVIHERHVRPHLIPTCLAPQLNATTEALYKPHFQYPPAGAAVKQGQVLTGAWW